MYSLPRDDIWFEELHDSPPGEHLMSEQMILGAVAAHFGCRPWQVRRLYERGILPPARRIGLHRVVAPDELPQIETALRVARYLPLPAEGVR
jgi:hypothetical protein